MGRAAAGVATILGLAAVGLVTADRPSALAETLPWLAALGSVALAGRAGGLATLVAVAPALAATAGLIGGWPAAGAAAGTAVALGVTAWLGARLRLRHGDAGSRAFVLAAGALLLGPGLLGAVGEAAGQTRAAWAGWPPLGALVTAPPASDPTARHPLPISEAGAGGSGTLDATFPLGGCYRPGRCVPLRVVVRAAPTGCRGVVRCAPYGGLPHDVPVDLPGGGIADVLVPLVPEGARVLVWLSSTFQPPDARERGILFPPDPGQRNIVWVAGAGEDAPSASDLESRLDGPVHVVAEADLPSAAWAYEAVDLLVCGRLDGSRLPAATARAIGGWVSAGGAIVLTDPDLLRRAPALDRALFDVQAPGEDPPPPAGGMPAAHWEALRRRGVTLRDVTLGTADGPGRAAFRCGAGGGLLLLPPPEGAPTDAHTLPARTWATLLQALPARAAAGSPTVAGPLARLFPAPAPGGWPLGLLVAVLAGYPLGLLRIRSRRTRPALVGFAVPVAAAFAFAAGAPDGEAIALVRPGPARIGSGGPPGGTEWIVHVASARDARCAVGLPSGAVARPLAAVPGEGPGATFVELGTPARVRQWDLARGAGRLLSIRAEAAVWPDIVATPSGDALLVSNRTPRPVLAVCYAAEGGLLDLGPLAPHETRRCALPRPLPGPVATRRALAERCGDPVARAIAVAAERRSGTAPACLCAVEPDATWPGPPPDVAGARMRVLPPVLAVPVAER